MDPPTPATVEAAEREAISITRFWDGVGNAFNFFFRSDGSVLFYYRGLTPAESSSGHYNGGPNVERDLTQAEVALLARLVTAAKADSNRGDRIGERRMGSGALIEEAGAQRERVLLALRSAASTELHSFLHSLRNEALE